MRKYKKKLCGHLGEIVGIASTEDLSREHARCAPETAKRPGGGRLGKEQEARIKKGFGGHCDVSGFHAKCVKKPLS